jgi:hypothetical protein
MLGFLSLGQWGQGQEKAGQENVGKESKAGKLEISASLLDGQTLRGMFLEADSTKCRMTIGNAQRDLLANEIGLLKLGASLSKDRMPTEVVLLDGSKAFGKMLTGKSSGWRLEDGRPEGLVIPAKSIRAARLKNLPATLEPNWQAAINEPAESDAVIVMRGNESLERINGIIVQVQETSVSFELDGEPIEIPLEKLAGLIWFQRPLERIQPTIEIVSSNHSVWLAESFSTSKDSLDLKTQLNQTVSLPLSSIVSIDYSTANIRWLSDLEVLESIGNKSVDFKGKIASLDRAMAPRFVSEQGTLPSDVSSKEKDLYFPGPGRFTFRVPEGFQSFQAQIVRTDDGSQRTNLTIEIWQDDNRLSQQSLPYDVDSVDVNLPVPSGKKVQLRVACNSTLMVGTEVQWKQPRLKR